MVIVRSYKAVMFLFLSILFKFSLIFTLMIIHFGLLFTYMLKTKLVQDFRVKSIRNSIWRRMKRKMSRRSLAHFLFCGRRPNNKMIPIEDMSTPVLYLIVRTLYWSVISHWYIDIILFSCCFIFFIFHPVPAPYANPGSRHQYEYLHRIGCSHPPPHYHPTQPLQLQARRDRAALHRCQRRDLVGLLGRLSQFLLQRRRFLSVRHPADSNHLSHRSVRHLLRHRLRHTQYLRARGQSLLWSLQATH